MEAPLVLDSVVKRQLKDRQREAALEEAAGIGGTIEPHIVSCPYEPIGGAVVDVKRRGDEMQFPRGQVAKCTHCHRYFQIGIKVQMYGKKIPGT